MAPSSHLCLDIHNKKHIGGKIALNAKQKFLFHRHVLIYELEFIHKLFQDLLIHFNIAQKVSDVVFANENVLQNVRSVLLLFCPI